MAQILALLLAATDVLLAMFAFVVVARPALGVYLVGRMRGQPEGLDPDDPAHKANWVKAERLARRMAVPLVVLVFLWSFLSGAVIGLVRL